MARLIQLFAFAIAILLVAASSVAQQYRVDTLARAPASQYPYGIAFVPGSTDRFFFTEKSSGRIRYYSRGIRPEPFATVAVEDENEQGLLGIALHPHYPAEPNIYVFATRKLDRANVVLRYRDSSGIGVDQTLLAIIPRLDESSANVGGGLRFGPDGKLYVSVGDYGNPAAARDVAGRRALSGKILRINPDGSVPFDSPFPEKPFWSFGHGNPAGLSFDDATRTLYCVEGGTAQPNRILAVPAGGDAGEMPSAESEDGPAPRCALLYRFPVGDQPGLTSISMYRGKAFPRLRGKLLVAGHANPTIWTGTFNASYDSLTLEPFFRTNVGYASVEVDPDGGIVFANGPYRSSRILKLSPVVPGFLTSPPVDALEDVEYSYTPGFSGTPPSLTLISAPRGMTIDSATWTVRWKPAGMQADSGKFSVILRAENGAGFAEQRFLVRVINLNDPPGLFSLRQVPEERIVLLAGQKAGQTFRWERSVDPDGDSLRYTFQLDTTASFTSPFRVDLLTMVDSASVVLPARVGAYFWRVWASDGRVSVLSVPPVATFAIDVVQAPVLRVEKEPAGELPLEQNFPNPFNPVTSITYTLAHGGNVRLAVFNLLGQEVALLVDGIQAQGTHTVEFAKAGLPSGIYFYRLQAPGVFETRKMVIAR